jgi:protein-tyrosine phosphatase
MKVLFVCSGNAHRSPLAEALLKKLRPDLEVDSAGLHVAIPISEEAKKYLTKENAEQYLKKHPESLANKHLKDYDLIVAMQQRHKDAIMAMCPTCEAKTIVWNTEDPYNMQYQDAQRIYNKIKEKVAELAETL